MKIAKESWVIMAIGLADLFTTILFIKSHGAEEANPLFRRYWEMGVMVFILAKLAMLVGPLGVLEWARKRNPVFVSWALRSGIAAYLLMYGVGFVRLNNPTASAADLLLADPIVVHAHTHKGMLASFRHQRPQWMSEPVARPASMEATLAPPITPPSLDSATLTRLPAPISY